MLGMETYGVIFIQRFLTGAGKFLILLLYNVAFKRKSNRCKAMFLAFGETLENKHMSSCSCFKA